jgi:subtilisin-like proprotein convertase family protein
MFTFSNPTPIGLSGPGDMGPANLYPSTIVVSGVSPFVTEVTVTLRCIIHTLVSDISVILQGPDPTRSVELMSSVGNAGVLDVTYTFRDGATPLPTVGGPPTGTYRPTQYQTLPYPGPAPILPTSTMLSVFNGLDPNGTWSLFVVDRRTGNAGVILEGWTLTITNGPRPTQEIIPAPPSWILLGVGGTLTALLVRRRLLG